MSNPSELPSCHGNPRGDARCVDCEAYTSCTLEHYFREQRERDRISHLKHREISVRMSLGEWLHVLNALDLALDHRFDRTLCVAYDAIHDVIVEQPGIKLEED